MSMRCLSDLLCALTTSDSLMRARMRGEGVMPQRCGRIERRGTSSPLPRLCEHVCVAKICFYSVGTIYCYRSANS